jgi:hypothetical protein
MIFRICVLFFQFAIVTNLVASYKYDISACMIFRDEAPYLKEWIEFHRLVGIQHFYLYNNLSQDNYKEVLQPYIRSGIVELFEWDREPHTLAEWDEIQLDAYNHGLRRAKRTSKWLALLDSDEFLFPTEGRRLSKFLKKYEKRKGFGGLLVNWVVFGTSWVDAIPDDKLLIETLTYSASEGNDHFKTICLTERVARVCSPHYVQYKPGFRHFTPNNSTIPFIEIEDIRINHYWSRDEKYLEEVKIPRRLEWGTDADTCRFWAQGSNGSLDSAINGFIEPLRKRMHRPQIQRSQRIQAIQFERPHWHKR